MLGTLRLAWAVSAALVFVSIAGSRAWAQVNTAPAAVDHVVMGNALQTSGDAIYGARHVALRAGLKAADLLIYSSASDDFSAQIA